MEIKIKDIIIKFKTEILAVIALGIMMLVIAAYIPDEYTKSIIISLGTLLIMFPVFLILIFYTLNQMAGMRR